MKKCFLSISMLCLLFSGCVSEKKNESSLIELNVSASYPEKEIKLEEIADIEYLQLGVYEDFLFSRDPLIITSEKIIFYEFRTGDVMAYSRDGNPLFKFNRKGNGQGEYVEINQLIYNETTDEFFVKSFSSGNIMVYDAQRNFKRMIPLPLSSSTHAISGGANLSATVELVNFDSKTLLLFDSSNDNPFTLISKEDGSVIESIDIPKDQDMATYVMAMQMNSSNEIVGINILKAPAYHFVKYNDGYLLSEFSIDTVYFLSPDKKLSPFLVRQPAIQSMDPAIILNSLIDAGSYEFLLSVTIRDDNGALPKKYLMRDKKTGSIYRQKITFDDYRGKEITLSPETIAITQAGKLGLIVLSLTELQDANSDNKLSGKLKELVDNSEEDGNNIYMLLHFK